MKVLYLNTLDIEGGAARGANRLHQALKARGVDSTMLVMQKDTDDPTVLAPGPWGSRAWRLRNFFSKGLRSLERSPNPIVKSLNIFPTGTSWRVNRFGADIVQLHWIGSELISVPELARIKRPLVWRLADQWAFCGTEHYTLPGHDHRYIDGYTAENRPNGYAGLDLERLAWKRKMKHWRDLDLTIVTGSRWLADCARKSALFKNKRVETISSGVDLQVYRPLGRSRCRDIMNLDRQAKYILFGAMSATSDPRKGFAYLEPALRQVASQLNVQALVLGASEPVNPPDFGMPTTYIPRLHDDWSLALVYSAADVLVAPSTQDNLPFSVLEAQCCGTPCVAFNIGGMPDMIKHQENGWLAKPFETAELAQGLVHILKNENLRQNMGEKSRTKAKADYDVHLQAERYEHLYAEILESTA